MVFQGSSKLAYVAVMALVLISLCVCVVAHAVTVTVRGKIFAIAGDIISIRVEAASNETPQVGDEVIVSFALADGTPVKVGTWQVTEVKGSVVKAKKMDARGQVNVNMLATIKTQQSEPTREDAKQSTGDLADEPPAITKTKIEQKAEGKGLEKTASNIIAVAGVEGVTSITKDIGAHNWYDAQTQCKWLEEGGYTDWVLPTIDQLAQLYGLGTEILGKLNLQGCCVWSSNVREDNQKRRSTMYGWMYDFHQGLKKEQDVNENLDSEKYPQYRALCVRNTPIASSFEKETENIIRDKVKRLKWTRRSNGMVFSWAQANSYCKGLRQGSVSEWRLPTLSELADLMDQTFSKAATQQCHIKAPFQVDSNQPHACQIWSVEKKDERNAWFYDYKYGAQGSAEIDNKTLDKMKRKGRTQPWEGPRVFCVRDEATP